MKNQVKDEYAADDTTVNISGAFYRWTILKLQQGYVEGADCDEKLANDLMDLWCRTNPPHAPETEMPVLYAIDSSKNTITAESEHERSPSNCEIIQPNPLDKDEQESQGNKQEGLEDAVEENKTAKNDIKLSKSPSGAPIRIKFTGKRRKQKRKLTIRKKSKLARALNKFSEQLENAETCANCGKSSCNTCVADSISKQCSIHHSSTESHSCKQCNKTFKTKAYLKQHALVHVGFAGFKCSDCEKSFRLHSALIQHQKIHEAQRRLSTFTCDKCPMAFQTSERLEIHKEVHVTKPAPVVCEFCEREFNDADALNSHRRRHLGGNFFQCSVCDIRLSSQDALDTHCQIHLSPVDHNNHVSFPSMFHPEQSQPIAFMAQTSAHSPEGQQFQEDLPTSSQESQRQESSSGQSSTPQQGKPEPGDEESTDGDVPASPWTTDRTFICDYCPKAFRRQGDLARHTKIHTRQGLHYCDVCNRAFTEGAVLRQHKRIHTGEMPYQCEACGKKFRQRGNLMTHKRRHHTGERPYECEMCPKKFVTIGDLHKHQTSHTGERNHVCGECNKAFLSPTDLIRHERIHKRDWVYVCNVCGKEVVDHGNFRKHQKTHNQDTSLPLSQFRVKIKKTKT